ncbi:2-oxoglutarate dehydrogenase, E2 component, dihydrolipoamide succinyltransferase [Corynebacterium sphenisci]|uniref:2-oxoglutarate dehydrogenase, E2 component, dihydrolipoamide succinyltransferase n=1 Tax=Corynebacterium sphenisci TaxID=191493 RepID=UPI0026DED8E3|nr:2-oxoglutarate dehydrogenase, E2 component, dihydrolipoamide succinyltransferase [Corynebacterium sphenisci]MDO5731922.1 2-oxoglutarate dehydrogenase, E2 component, dihydrolipoamide succinyltransferase [Corynebacterium sphenisci]
MATSVEMPELGESVTEGTITTWLKEVGDTVEVDEPLLEVSTDKVDTEVPSPVAGTLVRILAEVDDTVDVGAVICEIGDADDAPAGDSGRDADEPAAEPEEPAGEAPKSSGGAATDVEMPELGESVTEGTITTWLKEIGDTVEVDEPLLEVSTDKVDTEVPSPVAGTLVEILAEVDDTVDVGAVICRVGDADAAPAGDAGDSGRDADEPAAEPEKPAGEAPKSSGGAATDVEMPELGESVTEGTITTWLKEIGDTVEVDEPLLEVSTDKVDTEVPSPVAGTLVEILAEVDDTVDVGAVICRVGDADAAPAGDAGDSGQDADGAKEAADGEAAAKKKAAQKEVDPGDAAAAQPAKEEQAAPRTPEPAKEAKPAAKDGDTPYVTPLVRKLADKHGVDLATVEGSGIGGRIRKQDVLRAAEAAAGGDSAEAGAEAAPASRASTKGVRPELAELRGTTRRVNRIREITAAKTRQSLLESAQLTQVHEVDMTEIWELRAEHKAAFADTHGAKLTFLPFFAKAVVEALVAHPNVNASWNDETKEITYHSAVNLGIAVDTERGLLSPVIHDAQEMSLPELAKAIADIAKRARSGDLKPKDLSGGTFTITNIGSEGALTDTPILVPPQAAMMGTGAIRKRPVVVTEGDNDAIGIRAMALLPLTYDHRLVDGADAGRFMTTVVDRLQVADFTADLEL